MLTVVYFDNKHGFGRPCRRLRHMTLMACVLAADLTNRSACLHACSSDRFLGSAKKPIVPPGCYVISECTMLG